MTSKQVKFLRKICLSTNAKDCIVACKWIHPEIDGGFPIVFMQAAGGAVTNCMAMAAQFDIDQYTCPLPDGIWHCCLKNDKFYIDGKEAKDD